MEELKERKAECDGRKNMREKIEKLKRRLIGVKIREAKVIEKIKREKRKALEEGGGG